MLEPGPECGFSYSTQHHFFLRLTFARLKGASSFFQKPVEASSSRKPSLIHSGQLRASLQNGVMQLILTLFSGFCSSKEPHVIGFHVGASWTVFLSLSLECLAFYLQLRYSNCCVHSEPKLGKIPLMSGIPHTSLITS